MSDHHPTIEFRRPDGRPLEPWHHLSLNPRQSFVLRLTVSGDKTFVGKRIVQQLRTRDAGMALAKRDAVIEAFKLAGMVCRDVVIADSAENVGQNSGWTGESEPRNS